MQIFFAKKGIKTGFFAQPNSRSVSAAELPFSERSRTRKDGIGRRFLTAFGMTPSLKGWVKNE